MSDEWWDILFPFFLAGAITWTVFYTVEIFIPFVDEYEKFQQKCEQAEGIVVRKKNGDEVCIKPEYIIK